MAIIRSGEAVSANGSYEFVVKPGRKYAFEPFYDAGTATITLFNGNIANGYETYQATQEPDSATAISIQKTTTVRSFILQMTGNRFRMTVASASGLALTPMMVEIPHGS